MSKLRRAFTMIELIMVIVILGIIGMIVTEVLAQAYKGAFYQQKYAEREVELERVLNIIEKRLKDALVDSIVLLDKNDVAGACEVIGNQGINDDAVAAFVMVDRDSMIGLWDGNRSKNGWSEEGNITGGGANTFLISPDADFNVADTVIGEIYPGKDITDAAVYRYPMLSNVCDNFGWTSTGAAPMILDSVTALNSATQLRINAVTTNLNTEQMYRFSSGAVAFKRNEGPVGNEGDGTLVLYTNFRPWQGQSYLNGTPSVVAEHVSHFAIRMDSGSAHSMVGNPSLTGAFYRINVCMKVVSDTNSSANDRENQICKEKSVYVR